MDMKRARVHVRVRVLVYGVLLFNWFFGFGCHAQPLPEHEVSALRAISTQLKNLNWDVDQNSCNGPGFFNKVIDGNKIIREVNCTCFTHSCSVTSIRLKRQNLQGDLPAAFANLSGLTILDLTRNLISGPIPAEFGRLPLLNLSLLGNQLSGQIPPEIGDIASLQELVLENNQLGGNLPESLGKLSGLRRLLLSANNFTGTIPESFGNLRNLTELYTKFPSTHSSPPSENQSTLSAGAVVGISAAAAFFIILVLGILWWRGCLGWGSTHRKDGEGLNLQIGSFTLKQITTATNNFDSANKIGEGGFGPVYKGILLDGTVIAVKKLSSKSKQGKREFVNEIGMISSLQHPYLVKLYGCCTERDQHLLVYEYVQNNSLARALFGPKECQLELNWPRRLQICIGIAKGLAFLHEESGLKIVHRDIKATNVLLDENLRPKISDFGLAKLDEEENTHISTRIAGTFGYMAPEYATRGHLTDKADVYSFGIVAFEIVSGRSNTLYRSKEKCLYLLDWALVAKNEGNLLELVDPRLGSNFDQGEAMAMINVALLCTNVSFSARPTMSSVVSMLEGKAAVEELTTNPNDLREEINAMWRLMQQNHKMNDNDCPSETATSTDMASTIPSSSFLIGN